ncbi:MAG: hypothetical protein IKI57_01180 [Clostridia bacterium]|nr:hypothetical protein [Clostridia bacterium]
MSSFKDKITKQVEIINDTISNDDERAIVLNCIQSMIQDFTTHVIQLTERQNEVDQKLTDVYDILTNIESTINDEENDEELFGTCPYCGDEIPLILKDGEFADIECPSCHNTIEMEMAYEYDNQNCSHDGCGSCCGGSCNMINDDQPNKNNDCKKRKK